MSLEFLVATALRYRRDEVRCILDSACYHSTTKIEEWLARHPHILFQFTPMHASRLRQVAVWLSIIARKVIERGDFGAKPVLRKALRDCVSHSNVCAHPCNWVYGYGLVEAAEWRCVCVNRWRLQSGWHGKYG